MVKEEIKAFLGNRRISQAVVAQVTGEWTHPPPARAAPLLKLAPPQLKRCVFAKGKIATRVSLTRAAVSGRRWPER